MLYVFLGILAYILIGVCIRAYLLCALSNANGYLCYVDQQTCDVTPFIWPFYIIFLLVTQPFKLLDKLSIKLAKACKRFRTGTAPERFY
jgi:hypothetical protein